MSYVGQNSEISTLNSSTATLNAAAVFTGEWERVYAPSISVAVKTDQNGTLTIEFSPDGTNADSSLLFPVTASINEIHKLNTYRAYFRAKFTNTSASNQTYFRLQALKGYFTTSTSSLNSSIQSDADATLVRPLDFNIMVAEGLYQNRQNTPKDGLTITMGNGVVTEDVWDEGGAYTGFPTATTEEGQIVVAGADTGTVYYSYLESAISTDYVMASKSITGAGNYDLGHNIYRCNFMYFVKNSTTLFNVGKISIRWKTTTTVIFCAIQIGYSQSYCAAYTVPYGSSIYVDRFQGNIRGSANGSTNGYIWYRPYGESPRLRFPYELQFGSLFFDDVDYLVKIPQQVDFIPRIILTSTNGLTAKFSYRLLKVKE